MKRKGMTLVEVMVASCIMAVVSLGVLAAFFGSSRADQLVSEQTRVLNALQEKMEDLLGLQKRYPDLINGYPYQLNGVDYRSTHFDAMLAFYQQNANNRFPVEGLETLAGGWDTGSVILYLDESKVPVELGGDASMPIYEDGMLFGPRDINGDGDTVDRFTPRNAGWVDPETQAERIGAYEVNAVPVEIRVQWRYGAEQVRERRFTWIARTDRVEETTP